jgi:isocitrate dehydrogenase (NAD+)
MAPGANFGEQCAVFEPVHGTAPKYAGTNRANPLALVLSAVMMLRHLGEHDAAVRLERAVAELVLEGVAVTFDLKASRDDPTAVGTSQVADALAAKLAVPVASR